MTLITPWPICAACRAIPPAYFKNESVSKPFALWTTFSEFATSASRGCHSCTLLFAAVREPFRTRLDIAPLYLETGAGAEDGIHVVSLTVDLASLPDRDTWDQTLWKHDDSVERKFHFVPIADVQFVTEAGAVPQPQRHFKDLISLYAEDDGMFRYITQSLTTCLTKHNLTCNRVIWPLSATASQRDNVVHVVHGEHGLVAAPTRVIHVGSEDPNDPPRLVDGQECLYGGGYLILSYCWGMTIANAPWLLRTDTVQQFFSQIPFAKLPQTLHDAILWARRLSMRYIWIDSLCIIQDQPEDWQREASRMASYYGCATLTLMAASSSVYGGISGRRNPLRNSAASLQLGNESDRSTIYLLPNGQPLSSVQQSPTESRGWCYQEDLLSSRIVILTLKTVMWQCLKDGSNPKARAQGLEPLASHPLHRWYALWYRFVERYSNKQLSFPKDRLTALYGIASDKAGTDYVAGFLKSDPWMSLLWCRDENQIIRHPGRRYEEYVAPSWSWASVDVPILYYEAGARDARQKQLDPVPLDPELHHVETQPLSYFDTGAVLGGKIELSAYALILRTASVQPWLFNTRQGPHTYGRRNCVDPLDGTPLGLIVFDVATEAADDMLLCCALLQTVDTGLWTKNGTAGLGVALKVQKTTLDHWECTRIGYIQLTPAFSQSCIKRRLMVF